MTKAQQPERKQYTLKAKHTHAGKDRQPGEKLQLTAQQAAFIAHKLDDGKPTQAEGK